MVSYTTLVTEQCFITHSIYVPSHVQLYVCTLDLRLFLSDLYSHLPKNVKHHRHLLVHTNN